MPGELVVLGAVAGTVAVMRVAVWRFDGTTGPQRNWASALTEQLRRAGVDVVEGDPYSCDLVSRSDRHVLSGGATCVGDGAGSRRALGQATELAELARDGQAVAVGVCLGAQMLAAAIAGEIISGPSPEGLECGIVDVTGTDGRRTRTATFHSHSVRDRFATIAGVEVLASNDHTFVQAYRWHGVTGVQFHPELDRVGLRLAVAANHDWVPPGHPALAPLAPYPPGEQRETLRRWLLEPLEIAAG